MTPVSLRDVIDHLDKLDKMQDGDSFLATKNGHRIYTEEVTHMQSVSTEASGGKISKIGNMKRLQGTGTNKPKGRNKVLQTKQQIINIDDFSSGSEVEVIEAPEPSLKKKAAPEKKAKHKDAKADLKPANIIDISQMALDTTVKSEK